jgi:arylsulfatase A-like enzyme
LIFRLVVGLAVPSATLLAALFFACSTPSETDFEPMPDEPHPIIIIDIDTLRADHLGCYGYERDTSPKIDALCEESAVFEWAFGAAPNTLPSQATLLTSLHPGRHGMFEPTDRLPEEATTLAEVMAEAGFTTAAFADGGPLSSMFGFDQGFQLFDSKRGGLERSGPKIFEWVREHAEENFLLFIHTYDVHSPYAPPEPYRSMFIDDLESPTPGFEPTTARLTEVRDSIFTDDPRPLSPSDLAYSVALYDGGIRYVDTWIGQFLEVIGELGLLDRATLVIVSDHGDEFQEHGSVGHAKLYSTVTHIPLIIRPPGGIKAQRVPEIVAGVDFMPTLLDLLGIAPPAEAQGRSLVPILEGKNAGLSIAFGESNYFGRRRFVAFEDFRLLYSEQHGERELYRFKEDPHEVQDLSATQEEWVARLHKGAVGFRQELEASSLASDGKVELTTEMEQQLRALGYIK